MLKIVANVSKKVPVPGLDFSSQSFMAGVEVEVSDGSTPEELQHRIREVYSLLEQAVDAEIREYGGVAVTSSASESPSEEGPGFDADDPRTQNAPRVPASQASKERSSSGKEKQRGARLATQAQQKAVFAIAKAQGMDRDAIQERLRRDYGVDCVEKLSLANASQLIDALKTAS